MNQRSTRSIYGVHDVEGARLIVEAGREGWCVIAKATGHDDPDVVTGDSYQHLVDQGITPIIRWNNGWNPDGTIPEPAHYAAFAKRVGREAAATVGCYHHIIGNEPNHRQEWPGDWPIWPEDYARCFVMCQNEIRTRAGPEHQVIVAAVAPWNVDSSYPGNESGDWLAYFVHVLQHIRELGGTVEAIALHTYTHGDDPALITSEARMNSPYEDRHFHFRAYQDFMACIPVDLRHVPIYITETDQDVEWADVNSGWVQEAYREIDNWNAWPDTQNLWCLALYRSGHRDKWYWMDLAGVRADFEAALAEDYQRPEEIDDMATFDGSLSGDVYLYQGEGQLKLIEPWKPYWTLPADGDPDWKDKRPEYGPASSTDPIIAGMPTSQKVHHNYATWTGGLVQGPVIVPQGAQVTFSAQVWMQTGENTGDRQGGGRCRVGVDPTGGIDAGAASVVWSGWLDQVYDRWEMLTAEAQAQGDRVTVFVDTTWQWPVQWNDLFLGWAELKATSEQDPPDPPSGGDHTVAVLLDGQQVLEGPFSIAVQGISFAPATATRGLVSPAGPVVAAGWPFERIPGWSTLPAWARWLIRQVFRRLGYE